ncbi:hypothetical protein CPC08DRAFT_756479 [Agrocybe pediades]|nr:hypothetical protein CPC08DRAFT_756479 [Agrocybe pediades]
MEFLTGAKSFFEAASAMVKAKKLVANFKGFPSTANATYSTELQTWELQTSANALENLVNWAVVFYHRKIDDAKTQIDAYYSKIDITKSSSKDFSSSAKRKLSLRGFVIDPIETTPTWL